MHLRQKKPKSQNIERLLEPSMMTMTCHLFRLCWRKSLLIRNDVVSSVIHVLRTSVARYAVFDREGRVEQDAERTPSRRSSTGYDVTNDLPDQLRVRFEQARRDQTEQPSGVPFAGKVTRSNFMAFMANRILPKELVEHQEEFKNLPEILTYYRASPLHTYVGA